MLENRNLIMAIAASILILLGFQFFVDGPRQRQRQEEAAIAAATAPAATGAATPAAVPPGDAALVGPAQLLDRDSALGQSQRIPIETAKLHGSIALTGGRIDDVTLRAYRETVDPASPEIKLFSPLASRTPYYAEFGWTAVQGSAVKLPGADSVWTGAGKLTEATPVTLTFDNGEGLVFTRTIAVDANYMFSIEDRVQNNSGAPVALFTRALVARVETPQTEGLFILHEGPIGVLAGQLQEHDYQHLREETVPETKSKGGWIGITDKYWLAAVIPDQAANVTGRFDHAKIGNRDRYETSYLGEATTVAPGAAGTVSHRLFAGAKIVDLLQAYRDNLGINMFEYAVDFGWFFFLTKPIFLVLDFLYRQVGNFGVAILILTLFIKGLFYPLANKSYRAMNKMKDVQPEMMALRERFADDKARQQQELMALYKREKINPLAGCLPILVQIPVFFSLYKVLYVTIEMRHAPFFGWIQDLSAPDPTHVLNLFGLIPWDPPSFLALGVWPVLMGISMWLQQKMNPAPPDPIQQRVFMFMPIIFTFFLASFPAGLVIYWTWNNVLSIAQQWLIRRQEPPKPAVAAAAAGTAKATPAKPSNPTGGRPPGKR
ncbi:membrane protein insertase YidC [Zavarzinia compransoris]|uniref:Membrane protein insertase YidC n=1 Tax=Zavarzinia compransoris TaxID=1264899 RepID=A0A317DWY6_9PROT|nr:membrane protein insertase YidC [Zavarzinia compransoris]PWR19199.1 membrane protein insertase YidC [Zavarzinia compransoris]TDP48702.1 protein translocase subunit yidC [Zavarzinia compransoris]